MITVILENQAGEILDKAARIGNEKYLCQDDTSFPILSQLSMVSYDVFGRSDMPGLIRELERLRKINENSAEESHIEKILGLATKCDSSPGLTLTFTPFEEIADA